MMQGRVQFIGLLAVVTLFSGCWKKTENVEQSDANSSLMSGIKLVNVLDANYFEDAHIPGSINISLDALEDISKSWGKDDLVVVYCANYHCSASDAAARKLVALGFTNVKAYEAGTAGWFQAGYPIDGSAYEGYLFQPNEKIEIEADASEDDVEVSNEKKYKVVEITTDELASVLGIQKTGH